MSLARPKKPCIEPRCPNLVESGGPSRCPQHRRERWRKYEHHVRAPRDRTFYHSAAWLKVRRYVLGLEPLCRECKASGLAEPATQVDHQTPIADGGAPLDTDNLVPLCRACHSRKTMRENRAGGKL